MIWRAILRGIATGLGVLPVAWGCYDSGPAVSSLSPTPSSAVAFLSIEETAVAQRFILRASVTVGGGLNLPSAFRATLIVPGLPGGAATDVSTNASVLRAFNASRDTVRVAGASISGFDELFAFSVEATSREALNGAHMIIEELVDRQGNDLRPVLRTVSRPLMGRRK